MSVNLKRTRYKLVRSLIHLRPEKIGCGQNTYGLVWSLTARLAEEYTPGKSIKFRFTGPKGFDGFHGYEIVSGPNRPVVLRHTLKMSTYGPAILSWSLIYRPMHDALMEDSLATAQVSLGLTPKIQAWSLWVKILRWVISGGKAHTQVKPNNSPADVATDEAPHLSSAVRRKKWTKSLW